MHREDRADLLRTEHHERTHCPNCGQLLIGRYELDEGYCDDCIGDDYDDEEERR